MKRDFQGTPRQLAEREKPLNGASLSSFPAAAAATAAPSSFAFTSHALRPAKPQRSPLVTTPTVLLELVSLYFRFVHNVAHTLFHEASFIRRFNEGRASLLHVHAMCALSARYFVICPFFLGGRNFRLTYYTGTLKIKSSMALHLVRVGRSMRRKPRDYSRDIWDPLAWRAPRDVF